MSALDAAFLRAPIAQSARCREVLKAGGSAVDAAVAANAVLLTQAEFQLDREQYEQALATLRRIEENSKDHSHALALLGGELYDAETALEICAERAGDHLLARTLMPRLDPDLRSLLDQGTRFKACPAHEPAAAEYPEEAPCSWDA